jgi:hypothetical protein
LRYEHLDGERSSPGSDERLAVRLINPLVRVARSYAKGTARRNHDPEEESRGCAEAGSHSSIAQRAWVRTALSTPSWHCDAPLLDLEGGPRLFRCQNGEEIVNLSARKLNDYIQYMGTNCGWGLPHLGRTLIAAVASPSGVCETQTEANAPLRP